MKRLVTKLLKYGITNESTEARVALSLSYIIDIASKQNFKDILDICKLILGSYGCENSDGSFYLKPISNNLCSKIFELEKNTRKRMEQNLINKINNIIKE